MSVRFRAGKWYALAHYKGQRLAKACDTQEEAEATEKILLEKLGKAEIISKAPKDGTMGHVLNVCRGLDWCDKPDMLKLAGSLVAYFGSDTLPAAIDEMAIDKWVAWLRTTGPSGRGCANSTIRHYLSALRVMLCRAQRLRLVADLPLFPEKRLFPLPEPRRLVIVDEWFHCLVDELERAERRTEQRLTWFLWHMGCRVSEALELTWDRVDIGSKTVLFTKTKGKEARRLPLPRAVRTLIEPLRDRSTRPSDRVFLIGYGTYLAVYRAAVDRVCDRLGLGPDVRREWVIHSLRHTCLTRLAQQGWSGPQIQAWGGHRSMQVTERYVHQSAVTLEHLVDC